LISKHDPETVSSGSIQGFAGFVSSFCVLVLAKRLNTKTQKVAQDTKNFPSFSIGSHETVIFVFHCNINDLNNNASGRNSCLTAVSGLSHLWVKRGNPLTRRITAEKEACLADFKTIAPQRRT